MHSRFWRFVCLFFFAGEVPLAAATQLTVSAAASLSDPLGEIKTAYTHAAPDVALTFNFGGSGLLQQQIMQGAPVDLFIAAAPRHMDALEERGRIVVESRRNLLSNVLVLIAPRGTSVVQKFDDLASASVRRIMIGDPKAVPAGAYAEELLSTLNLMPAVSSKIVRALDVRQVLAAVATRNVDAGFVYATEAQRSNKVRVVATAPKGSHAPIQYPMAIIAQSRSRDAAERFATYLQSAPARAVFVKWGFLVAQ
jgi:molybdate transport system substrate-binding protein